MTSAALRHSVPGGGSEARVGVRWRRVVDCVASAPFLCRAHGITRVPARPERARRETSLSRPLRHGL